MVGTWSQGTSKEAQVGKTTGLSKLISIYPYLELWNLLDPWNLYLEPRNLAEPCGMTAPKCPSAQLAETPKLLAVGERKIVRKL